jgi:hypothetical protein
MATDQCSKSHRRSRAGSEIQRLKETGRGTQTAREDQRWKQALCARECGGGGGGGGGGVAAGDIYAYNSAERVGSTPLFAALIPARPLCRQPLSSTCCHTLCAVFMNLFQPIMKPWRMQTWEGYLIPVIVTINCRRLQAAILAAVSQRWL